MSFIINNTVLSRIFAGNKPIRRVVAAQKDGTGQQTVFNTNPVRLDFQVYTTGSEGLIDKRRMVITSNSPYTEKIKLDFSNIVHAIGIPPSTQFELSQSESFVFDYSVYSSKAMITIEYDLEISVLNGSTWLSSQSQQLRGQNPYTSILDFNLLN